MRESSAFSLGGFGVGARYRKGNTPGQKKERRLMATLFSLVVLRGLEPLTPCMPYKENRNRVIGFFVVW